nr:helix-turn-helix domain-containing protein [Burkholderia vietnamiensis]
MIEKARNTSVRAIARLLGRSASTITRELARNRRLRTSRRDVCTRAKPVAAGICPARSQVG